MEIRDELLQIVCGDDHGSRKLIVMDGNVPQSGRSSVALEDELVFGIVDIYLGGCECCCTAVVAQHSNGHERVRCQCGKNMCFRCRCGQVRDWQVSRRYTCQLRAIRECHMDWLLVRAWYDRALWRDEMSRGACVGHRCVRGL